MRKDGNDGHINNNCWSSNDWFSSSFMFYMALKKAVIRSIIIYEIHGRH